LCNKQLLGSELRRPFKTYLNKEEKIEKDNLTFAYTQIRRRVDYQFDKHNAKISRCRVQARSNAKKSKKRSGYQSDKCFKNGDLKCYKSGDEDDEESTEEDSDDEEDVEASSLTAAIQEVQEEKWFSEDEYAEDTSEGKIFPPMHDSSIFTAITNL